MWAFECLNNDKVFYLKPDNFNLSIGRNADLCEFVITGDTSISRKHCSVSVKDSIALVDHGSKYGTYINDGIDQNERILPNIDVALSPGDVIRFGIINNIWRLAKHCFISSISKLNAETKLALISQLKILGGKVSEDWSNECKFLTMTKITLTHKVVMALINNAYIVSPGYWSACINAFNMNNVLPDANLYLPEILESSLNQETVDFSPNQKRKEIFMNKKVIFFSRKQKQTYDIAITSAGGLCFALAESKLSKSMLCSEGVIVIQYLVNPGSQESQVNINNLNNIVAYIESKGKRLIPEPEIGLAVLYCSLEKYCNPDFDFPNRVCANHLIISAVPNEAEVLAVETQDSIRNKISLSPKVINASLSDCQNVIDISLSNSINLPCPKASTSFKRKLTPESSNSALDIAKKTKCNNNHKMFEFLEKDKQVQTSDKDGMSCSNKQVKLLNLIMPKKRYRNENGNDDNLFIFENDLEAHSSSKRNRLNAFTLNQCNDSMENVENGNSKICKVNTVQSEVKQGKKIVTKRSIFNDTIPWLSKIQHSNVIVKKKDEISSVDGSDLNQKLMSLDLGQTIIVVNNNLSIKHEQSHKPVQIPGCNFKKFHKVPPLKPQKSIIHKSVMVIYRPITRNAFNTTASEDEESDKDELACAMNYKMSNKKANIKSRRL